MKTTSFINNNILLLDVVNDLQQIVIYAQDNLMKRKQKNKEINLDEEESLNYEEEFTNNNRKKEIKLGEKRIKSELLDESDDNEVENKVKKIERNRAVKIFTSLKNYKKEIYDSKKKEAKLKTETIDFRVITIEIIKKIKEIIAKINNSKLYTSFKIHEEKKVEGLKVNNIIKQNLLFKDGRYRGQVENGFRQGKGVMYYYNDNKYEGDWKNDKKDGKGIMRFNSGNRYEGSFKNDSFEGKGTFYFSEGDKYIGYFKDNKFEGKGIYYYNVEPNKGDKYKGE